MGYKKDDMCLNKAYNDEKIFVLMARDSTAPSVVVEWIKNNIGTQPREKLVEALDCAIEMHNRCAEMVKRKNLEKEGWMLCARELPRPNTSVEVVYANGETGHSVYWSDYEGFDGQTEPHGIEVIAWKLDLPF